MTTAGLIVQQPLSAARWPDAQPASSRAAKPYRIGFLIEKGADRATLPFGAAAAWRNYSIVVVDEPAELASLPVDFVVANGGFPLKPTGRPTFAVIRDAKVGFWDDAEWLTRLSTFDGYLTVSDPVRRFLQGFCRINGREPCVGFFDLTPQRQLAGCQLEKLLSLGAFRLCHIRGIGEARQVPLLEALASRSCFRLYRPGQDEASANGIVQSRELPTDGRPTERIFAAFGAGLVAPAGEEPMDAAAMYALCQIVSVGALAFCPDIPWIRQHFGESVYYFPSEDPIAAAQAIDHAVEEIQNDPAAAAERARAARMIFEEHFAAEVMLQNAVRVFEEWRELTARSGRSTAPGTTVVNTDAHAIEGVFARLPAKTLAAVGRAVAGLSPLTPLPHWRFGGFVESADLAVHVRHSLWRAGKARGGAGPIAVPWHAGTRLNLYLDNDLSLTLFAGGAFEPNEFALLDRVLQPGMVFLDGGANEGAYTVFAAARVGPKGRVIAVEPSSRELERLKRNIALNRLRNVDIVEVALAERAGSARLRLAEATHAGQNTLGEFAYAISAGGDEQVATMTLDELVEERGLDRLDILKLDIEGAELRALSSGWHVLRNMKPLILTEVSDASLGHQGGSAAALLQLLEDAGYVVLTIGDETGLPVPLRCTDREPSDNVVAVHRDRDWGLIAGSKAGKARTRPAHSAGLRKPDSSAPVLSEKTSPYRVWIDVGAYQGDASLQNAVEDPCLVVHAFEPVPELCAALANGPPNYMVHPMAVSDYDGIAPFRINRFTAASSLLALDEEARHAWIDGELLVEEREIVVPTIRLDTFMNEAGITEVEFLKVDAQGGDFAVIQSAGNRIRDILRIKLEVAITPRQLYKGAIDKATIIAYLQRRGFSLTNVEPQSHGQEENLTFVRR